MLVARTLVPVFLCPNESRRIKGLDFDHAWALKSYSWIAGTDILANDGIFHRFFTVRIGDVTDGTSNTVMIGERPPGHRAFGARGMPAGATRSVP